MRAAYFTKRSTPCNQPLPGNAGQLVDHFSRVAGAGGLDHRQIETVAGKTRKGIAVFDKLDQERRGSAGTTRPAIQITLLRRLVVAAEENFRIALSEVRGNRGQAYQGA